MKIGVFLRLTSTGPPLVRADCGAVEDKLLRLWVVRGGGLQAADEGAVAQLRLGVRPNNAQVPRLAHPLGLLLHRALAHDRGQEHDKVDAQRVAVLCYSGAQRGAEKGPGRRRKD